MSLILCLETATTMCSVALGDKGKLIASKELNEGYTHSENLTGFVLDVLKEAKINIHELDAVAVSKGPGSYTGLRIGVSAAKGLCYALEKPLISVGTLYSMFCGINKQPTTDNRSAEGLIPHFSGQPATLFCPMLDARRMEVYCTVLDENGKEMEPVAAKIIGENSFAAILEKNKIIFFGDGSAKCKDFLGQNPNAVFVENIFPSAVSMIALAEEKFKHKEFEDVAYFEPFYLKDFIGTKK